MNIWKMNLSYKGTSYFAFCKARNIIGHGWVLSKPGICTYEEYEEEAKIDPNYSQKGKIKYALRCAINAFNRMNVGDLVILHDEHKRYYICIVQGKVEVAQDINYRRANISCYRKVEFLPDSLTESELWELDINPKHCIARHTIERIHTTDKGNIEDYVKEKVFSYLS